MKKQYIGLLSAALFVMPMQMHADIKLNSLLDETAAKVDTDGEYLQMNYMKNDITNLLEYADFIIGLIKKSDTEVDIPKDLDIHALADSLGLNDFVAMAASNKKVYSAWNNKVYTYNNGSVKGINSFYGGSEEKFAVIDFAPEQADIALQMRLDLRQLTPMIEKIAKQFGKTKEMERDMKKPVPELAGMTPFELLEKINIRASIAVELDRKTRINLPEANVATPHVVARLDNASWVWEFVEPVLMEESGLPWKREVLGEVKTYTLPVEMAPEMMGYLPVIRVDSKHIWIATKVSTLDAALSDAPKLKDNKGYNRTMMSLPKAGNWLAYVSEEFQDETIDIYRQFEAKEIVNNPDFESAKPIIDQLIKDLTSTGSGIAAVIDVDDKGVLAVVRGPIPFKNYIDHANIPAIMAPIIVRQMETAKKLKKRKK